MEMMSVPPGFISLTSFNLKRADDSENCSTAAGNDLEAKITSPYIVNIANLKRSLKHRPWIFHNQLDDFPAESDSTFDVKVPLRACLPKGVIRGCPSCDNCQKVMASWRPEESCTPGLKEVPVFHPTDEEFKDALKYVASIRSKAESYGICRIVPPASWQPPCLLNEKSIWESSKFNTCVQRINELQNRCLESQYCKVHEKVQCKRRKVLKSLECESCDRHTTDADEDGLNAESSRFESGPEFTLESFKKYADDFQRQYFRKKDEVADSSVIAPRELEGPSAMDVEGEYWRVVETPSEEIEVLCAIDVDTRLIGSGFPVKFNSEEVPKYHEYAKSDWNLNNIPKLPDSLLNFERRENSAMLFPRVSVGMCFSSLCWNVEEHHLFSLCYSHMGAPRVWYCIPGRYRCKFDEVVKKHYPQLSEHPELLHKLVPQVSPSTLTSAGVPVYLCVQYPREFVLVFPGVPHSIFNCGFNCSEAVNFAPLDWLPHGQNSVELYCEQRRKTSISHDKILLGAATRAVKAQWELVMKNKTLDNERWSVLATAFKSRIKQESSRREYLCNSSQSRKMEDDFDAVTKRECCICFYDLHLSAASCSCSPDKYTCLCHAKQLCSCAWSTRSFLFRYEISELNILVEALEGKSSAVDRWAKEKLGLISSSYLSNIAGDHIRLVVELPFVNPVKQRMSNSVHLSLSNGANENSTSTPDADITGSLLHRKSLIKENAKDENGTSSRGSQPGEGTVLVSNENPRAREMKRVPVEEFPHDKFSSYRNRDNASTRKVAEKLSRDPSVVIILSDDEDE